MRFPSLLLSSNGFALWFHGNDRKMSLPHQPSPPITPENAKGSTIRDVEKNEDSPTLQREISGPPYSVFSPMMRIWIIFLVSISALISPFGATLFYPALNVMSDVLHVTPTMTNLAVTTYMVRPENCLRQPC